MNKCENFCAFECINGGCPIAHKDEYIERDYDVVTKCIDCLYYTCCCDDCIFCDTELCPEIGGEIVQNSQVIIHN